MSSCLKQLSAQFLQYVPHCCHYSQTPIGGFLADCTCWIGGGAHQWQRSDWLLSLVNQCMRRKIKEMKASKWGSQVDTLLYSSTRPRADSASAIYNLLEEAILWIHLWWVWLVWKWYTNAVLDLLFWMTNTDYCHLLVWRVIFLSRKCRVYSWSLAVGVQVQNFDTGDISDTIVSF